MEFECEPGDGMRLRVVDNWPHAWGVTFEVYDPENEGTDYDVWLNIADVDRLVDFLMGRAVKRNAQEGQ